jgi:hypothetical protein
MTVRLRESPTRASTTRTMCAQGKHFPKVSLTGNGQRYELQDVAVTSCDVQRDETRIVLSGKVTHTKTGHVTLLK